MENEVAVNELIREVLFACNCLAYAKCFEGLDKSAFRNLSLVDLKGILAAEEGHDEIALKISDELLRFSRISDQGGQIDNGNHELEDSKPELNSDGLVSNNPVCKTNLSTDQESSQSLHVNHLDSTTLGQNLSNNVNVHDDGHLGEPSASEKVKQESQGSSESDSDYEPLFPPRNSVPEIIEVRLESDSELQYSSTSKSTSPSSRVTRRNNSDSNEKISSQSTKSSYSFRNNKTHQRSYNDQSDHDSNGTSNDSYSDSSTTGDSNSEDSGSNYSDEPRSKRSKSVRKIKKSRGKCLKKSSKAGRQKRKTPFEVSNPVTVLQSLQQNRSILGRCSYVKLVPDYTTDYHNCSMDDPPVSETQSWVQFYERVGPHIFHLDLNVWSWRSNRSNCPFNLNKTLQSCPNLCELNINIQILPEAYEEVLFTSRKSLQNLEKLTVSHSGEILYKQPLISILKAATSLKSFEYTFHSLEAANDILDALRDVSSLKSLSLKSFAKDGYLKRDQIERLKQIGSYNLEVLELGNGMWEDVDGHSLESLLRKFSKLKKFKVCGSYQGNSLRKPDIIIAIPPMPNLQFVDIGGNYEFASVDQSIGQSTNGSLLGGTGHLITVEDELPTELFSVSIKFPLLSNLRTLILGNLFKIDELHFSSFPILRVFRVGSPWHLTVKFTENKESRKFAYPSITDLQLPDCLKDSSFVQNIPARFPNLKKSWIFLPSVKVLRTFFKSMERSQLEELYLKTQYDFEATMEQCLLGQPSRAPKNYRDYMRFEDLQKYRKFQEFVQFYNIELPPTKIEDMRELEDDSCAGLQVLKKLKVLQLEHIPRILRIPKGKLLWTHVNAEFTNNFIGFKQYPLSGKCLEQLPVKRLKSCTWPNFIVNGHDANVLYRQGFESCGDEDMEVVYDGPGTSKTQRRSGVDRRGEKLRVEIQPAMLQASIQFREKKERK